ncbi:MAG: hypothetical protein ACO34E_04370 [Limisphaerales bacterium]
MSNMKYWSIGLGLGLACCLSGMVGAAVYENDFEAAELGEVPAEMLVMDGGFAVCEFEQGRVLELPGAPLETFGVLFGGSARDGVEVGVRVHSSRKGRRYPVFAVSAGGVSGYRLQVSPAKGALELLKGEQLLSSVDWQWKGGEWTHLRLAVEKTAEGAWSIRGKAWMEGEEEPGSWLLVETVEDQPPNGKGGIWGKPFAGTAIRFDDVRVEIQ